MIGHGVNDAPGLGQADLGIALSSGADIAIQAAPLVLMNCGLHAVTETLDLARRAFRIVRQNLFWAYAYNVGGITLAVIGALNPILAAARWCCRASRSSETRAGAGDGVLCRSLFRGVAATGKCRRQAGRR
jgi:hypothetical protein